MQDCIGMVKWYKWEVVVGLSGVGEIEGGGMHLYTKELYLEGM